MNEVTDSLRVFHQECLLSGFSSAEAMTLTVGFLGHMLALNGGGAAGGSK